MRPGLNMQPGKHEAVDISSSDFNLTDDRPFYIVSDEQGEVLATGYNMTDGTTAVFKIQVGYNPYRFKKLINDSGNDITSFTAIYE
jgi:hypothetical protein